MPLRRLFVLGDSISIQYGPYLEQFLAGRFQYARKTGMEPALQNLDPPHDANGRDSTHVLIYLRAMQAHGGIPADALLLNCGLHDLKTDPATGEKQVPPDLYESNLLTIMQLVGDMGLKLVWVRTTPVDDAVHNTRPGMEFYRYADDCEIYNAIADDLMRAFKQPSIDLYGFTRRLGSDLYCDHVHFHEAIREKQAAYIAGWLEAHFI
ncbi:MAG: SGNH/GDSL hydrolase family protein [Anaerolineae bacterium]|nr:SGNH/GDSL hydrolase family protein [Anaerolineae bacterium]